MSGTPETDDIARGNHVVPTEWAQQLERERDEARRLLGYKMGDTPETDFVNQSNDCNALGYGLMMFHARKLERERDEALSQIVQAECRAERFCQERDEAREKLHRVLKLLDEYDEAIKNPSSPFLAAFKKLFAWGAGK